MGKDAIEAAHRVLARIEQRRALAIPHERLLDASEAVTKATQRLFENVVSSHRQALIDCFTTGTGYYVTPEPEWIGVDLAATPRRCICCGAPAGEVQHD